MKSISILGAGNIGLAIATGLIRSGIYSANDIILTRRRVHLLSSFQAQGFITLTDNVQATREGELIIVAVEPRQIDSLLREIAPVLSAKTHCLVSVALGVSLKQLATHVPETVPIVRAIPNTAITVGEAMTCLAFEPHYQETAVAVQTLFAALGQTLVVDEVYLNQAAMLSASGIAFFLRAIRATMQGGVEIGISTEAVEMLVAQTAKGAAALLLENRHHPEVEIDRVTTAGGSTITGLNQMERAGLSAAIIQGILAAADKAEQLYG